MTIYQVSMVLTFISGIVIAGGMFYVRREMKRPEDRVAVFVFGGFGIYLAIVSAVTGFALVNELWFHVLWAGILPPMIWMFVNDKKWRSPKK